MIDRRTFIGGCVAAGAGAALPAIEGDYLQGLIDGPIEHNDVLPAGNGPPEYDIFAPLIINKSISLFGIDDTGRIVG